MLPRLSEQSCALGLDSSASSQQSTRKIPLQPQRERLLPSWKYRNWNTQPIAFDEIARALNSHELEARGEKSNEAWSAEEHASRENHIFRVACLVSHRDDTPIKLTSTGGISDGRHRVVAALYRGDESILAE